MAITTPQPLTLDGYTLSAPRAKAPLLSDAPITYGIWINKIGWLRDYNNRVFADTRLEYAQAALRMWKVPTANARIELIDESMIGLQAVFLDRERERELIALGKPRKSVANWIRSILNGILGRFTKA